MKGTAVFFVDITLAIKQYVNFILRMNERKMNKSKQDICPVEYAEILNNKIRKFFQNPEKILKLHAQEGMSVLDIGCGSGFFSLQVALIVEPLFHVSKSAFQQTLQFAKESGFLISRGFKMIFHRTVIIKKVNQLLRRIASLPRLNGACYTRW